MWDAYIIHKGEAKLISCGMFELVCKLEKLHCFFYRKKVIIKKTIGESRNLRNKVQNTVKYTHKWGPSLILNHHNGSVGGLDIHKGMHNFMRMYWTIRSTFHSTAASACRSQNVHDGPVDQGDQENAGVRSWCVWYCYFACDCACPCSCAGWKGAEGGGTVNDADDLSSSTAARTECSAAPVASRTVCARVSVGWVLDVWPSVVADYFRKCYKPLITRRTFGLPPDDMPGG